MEGIIEIIIPVHKISNRRPNLIKLLALGPRSDISFIVVSDSSHSKDHSEVIEIVKSSKNPHSKVVTGNFGSPGLARNAGLSVASARWLTFVDSDDDINLNKLALLISNAEKESAQLAIGGIIFSSAKSPTRSYYYLNLKFSVLDNLSLTPAFTRMVFQRNLLSEIVFPEFKMAEDQCFVLDVLALSPRIHMEEIYFYTYVLGDVSQAIINRRSLMDLPLSIAYIQSQFKKYKPDLQQVAVTMIFRQSATYLFSVGLLPASKIFKVLKILGYFAIRHPVRTGQAITLILLHRPRSFV